jgi:hypothetical protein
MCKIMEEPDRKQMTIRYGACAKHAGYLRLQTHPQNMQHLLLFFTATMVARTCLNITIMLILLALLRIQCYGLFNANINILDYVSSEGRITNK